MAAIFHDGIYLENVRDMRCVLDFFYFIYDSTNSDGSSSLQKKIYVGLWWGTGLTIVDNNIFSMFKFVKNIVVLIELKA